jgi:hypothetical protein
VTSATDVLNSMPAGEIAEKISTIRQRFSPVLAQSADSSCWPPSMS